MHLVFRCDSSNVIGSGHIMRCFALAEQARKRKIESTFFSKNFPGHALRNLNENGYKVELLDPNLTWEQDAKFISDRLKSNNENYVVIVDNYSLDARWENRLRTFGKVVVIDDLADRKHACDLLIDNSFSSEPAKRYENLVSPETKLLLGPKYSFLRDEIIEQRKKSTIKIENQVLVFFGGADHTSQTLRFVQQLNSIDLGTLDIKVVVAPTNIEFKSLKNFKPKNFEILLDPKNFGELLSQSELYYGSGGTVTWERLYLGTPGIVVSIADNQVHLSKQLAQAGYQIYLGVAEKNSVQQAIDQVKKILSDLELRKNISEKGRSLVDVINIQDIL